MQQFQVPQFITVEDRIIGPLTLKQFLYLLGGAAVIVLGWTFLYFILFAVVAVPLAGLSVALAFVKVSGRPLPQIAASAATYYLRPRLYIWKKVSPKSKPQPRPAGAKKPPALTQALPRLSESKLADIAWSLDIREKLER